MTIARAFPWLDPGATPWRRINGSNADARYGLMERRADWLAGRLDGRERVIAVPEAAGTDQIAVNTGHMQELASLAEQRMAGVMARYHRRRTRLLPLRATRMAAVEAQMERTNQAGQRLAEADKEDPASRRRLADDHRPATYVRHRQRVELEQRQAAIAASYAAEIEQLGNARQRVAAIDANLKELADLTTLQIYHAHAHCKRRIFAYWGWLVRHHPDSADLNDRCVPAIPSIPEWAGPDQKEELCE